MSLRPTALVASLAVAAALASAGSASAATTVRGVVVHRNARAHSFVVAARNGRLTAVHARRAPRVARFVEVRARRLANGTFAAQRVNANRRRARHARIRGTVTFARRGAKEFVVSSAGTSLLVRTATRSEVPSVGQNVVSDVTVDDRGDLEADDVNELGQATGAVELEGVVLAVDTTNNTLTISADDEDSSGQSIVVDLPAGFDASQFRQGQEVELRVTPNGDGTFTAVASSGDDNAAEADDRGDDQHADDQGEHSQQQGDDHESASSSSGSDD